MDVSITGYRIGASLEPPHPHCSISDPVYAAEGRNGRVALKVLNLGFPLREASKARYLVALTAVQKIVAPSVIRVVDAGFCADGRPYYAMERVDGEPAEARIARAPAATAAEVRAVLAGVANALAEATIAGCAPSIQARHIMLTPAGARVWHLGIDAWRLWAHELVTGTYTAAGQYMRHANMTPHEAQGRSASPANASAQLALLAFSLLAGRPYWDADLDLDASPMPMLMEVIANAGPPPSARSTAALPPGFDPWFARCLAGEVADPGEAARTFPG